jgi:hypothetical protein
LDGVGPRGDEGADYLLHVLDTGKELRLAEEAVVDCDVDAAAGVGMKQAVQAVGGRQGSPVA